MDARLITLASLAEADAELTQCAFRGCAPTGTWLFLEQGPPGSFPDSGPAMATLPPGADAWKLFPVDAVTGVGRGDSETGAQGQLSQSAWGELSDLNH